MNDSQLELQLARWLTEGPQIAPARVAGAASAYALAHPRGRGFNGWRSLVGGVGALARPTPVALRPLMLLMLLAFTFALGAFFYAAWHNNALLPVPSPTVEPPPSPVSDACPPGSSPNQPGPAGQQLPWTGTDPDIGWGPLVFDAASHQVLAIDRAPMSIWAFDVCHNTWAPTGIALGDIEPPRIMFLAEGGTKLVIDALRGGSVVAPEHRLIAYDRATGEAVVRAEVPFKDADVVYRTAPGAADEQVQVVVRYSSQLWAYDYAADSWQQLEQLGELPPGGRAYSEMALDPASDRLLLYTRNDFGHSPGEQEWGPRVYEYDFASSTWTRAPDPAIDIPIFAIDRSHHFAFDEQSQQLLAYYGDANAVRYDPARHQFDRLDIPAPPNPAITVHEPAVVYDSLNHRVVIVSAYAGPSEILALDLVSNQWFELLPPEVQPTPTPMPLACVGNPNDPGPVGQPRPALGSMAFDPARGRIYGFENGWDAPAAASIWFFDVCGNTWFDTGIALERGPDVAVYQPATDDALLVGAFTPSQYYAPTDINLVDLATGGVTELPQIPTGHIAAGGVVRTLTNQTVLIAKPDQLWTLDATASTWVELSQTGDVPPHDGVVFGVAYDQSTDRLILYAAGAWTRTGSTTWPPRTYEYDFGSATWLRGEDPPDVRFGGYGHDAYMAYDEAHAQTVLVSDNRVVGYDSTSHTWETLLEGGKRASDPAIQLSAPVVYDAVNQRIVAAPGDTSIWAFDLDTRAWVSLLAPAEP